MNFEIIKKEIEDGRAVIGIEFGSTRIKAVLTAYTRSRVISGKTGWRMAFGLTALRIYGSGCRHAISRWPATWRKNTAFI